MSKYIYAILGSLVISSAAFAATSTTPEMYKYGDKLDVAKVLSMSKIPDNLCEAVPATMTYLDSKGVQHTMEYQVLADGCTQ
jgi:hypothetical protein